jgi:hypothetical protein
LYIRRFAGHEPHCWPAPVRIFAKEISSGSGRLGQAMTAKEMGPALATRRAFSKFDVLPLIFTDDKHARHAPVEGIDQIPTGLGSKPSSPERTFFDYRVDYEP